MADRTPILGETKNDGTYRFLKCPICGSKQWVYRYDTNPRVMCRGDWNGRGRHTNVQRYKHQLAMRDRGGDIPLWLTKEGCERSKVIA